MARYWDTLRSHVKLIVLCVVVALAAAVAYVKVAPKSYTATAQMIVTPISPQNSVLAAVPGLLHGSGDPTTDILTAAQAVHTVQIAQATAAALHLHAGASDVLAKVSIVPLDQSSSLSVSTSSSSPAQAQRLVNTYAQQVVAVRTANFHHYISGELPGLKASVAHSPASSSVSSITAALLSQLEQFQGGPDPTIAVSSPATLPTAPTSPKTSLSLAAGALVGLLIGIGAAFGIDALDPRVRREGQLRERFAAVPVLARVPRRTGPARPGPLTPIDLPAAALEQYRTLRATLMMRAQSADGQACLLTGASPSEGKTTSAISLAAVLAQGGADVILIDADLRRPTIGRALGVRDFYGTEQVLSGEIALADALEEVRLGTTGFRVVAARGNSVEDADRLSPAGAGRLVEAAKRLADVVVIDSPPLTAVSDALPFAQVADQVLITVRVGQTKLSKLSEAWELLSHQGTRPSGIILVGVRRQEEYEYGYNMAAEKAGWQNGQEPVPLDLSPGQTRRP